MQQKYIDRSTTHQELKICIAVYNAAKAGRIQSTEGITWIYELYNNLLQGIQSGLRQKRNMSFQIFDNLVFKSDFQNIDYFVLLSASDSHSNPKQSCILSAVR